MQKRKICFVITSKIHYGRNKLVLEALRARDDIELQIVVGASAILPNYGDVLSLMEKDGFECNAKIMMSIEGGNPIAMAKTTGIGITEFATVFDNLNPDIVLVRGDRYEVLSATVAAAYLNIPVAHIEGGDLSGTIDESVRHAITKFSHIHFTTTDESKNRVIRMGERSDYVFNVGSPEIEFLVKGDYCITNDVVNHYGVGAEIDLSKPYIVVMQHPVTTETDSNRKNMELTLNALLKFGVQSVCFWPNIDAGTDEISKAIRVFRESNNPDNMRFIKYLPPEEFVGLLKQSSCLVGNSSAGIKECSYLGTPVINIGTRQKGRMRAENVMDVDYDLDDIYDAVFKQMNRGRYEPSELYYKKGTAIKIAEIVATIPLYTQKIFND